MGLRSISLNRTFFHLIRGIIDYCGKRRLNKNVNSCGDVRQGGDANRELRDCMFRVLRSIPKIDASIFDLDVVEGEPEGFRFFRGFFCRFGFLLLHEVRKIIGRLVNPLDVEIRLLESNLSEDKGHPWDGDALKIDIEFVKGDEFFRTSLVLYKK